MDKKTIGFLILAIGILLVFAFNWSNSTNPLWLKTLSAEIKSPPVYDGEVTFAFLGDQTLVRIEPNGWISHQVDFGEPYRFQLVSTGNYLLVITRNGFAKCFRKEDLSRAWAKETPVDPTLPPIKLSPTSFLVQLEKDKLIAVNAEDGEVFWHAQFSGEVIALVADQTLACIHGYSDLQNDEWKISAFDKEKGEMLWTYPMTVSTEVPRSIKSYFAFCSDSGRPIIVDQKTGEESFRHENAGYKIFSAEGEFLFNLAKGGSILECTNIDAGTSWSANLPSPIVNILLFGERVFVVDGKGIRCCNANSGEINWEKNLGKTFHAFSIRSGICVTYKNSFIDVETLITCFDTKSGAILWSCQDTGLFWKPLSTLHGDLVFCRSGNVRLMPVPTEAKKPVSSADSGAKTAVDMPRELFPDTKFPGNASFTEDAEIKIEKPE